MVIEKIFWTFVRKTSNLIIRFDFILFFIVGSNFSLQSQVHFLRIDTSMPMKVVSKQDLVHLKNKWIKKGYLFTSIDSTSISKDSTIWNLNLNSRYDKLSLSIRQQNNLDSIQYFRIHPMAYDRLEQKLKEETDALISKGYFKANFQYEKLSIDSTEVGVEYVVDNGIRYRVDSIRFFSNDKTLNIVFLRKILSIGMNRNNQELAWKEILRQLSYIDFVELTQKPDFSIMDSTAILNIYIKERKINQVNAILGIMSNAYNTNEVQLTGDVKLSLSNVLKKGINVQLNWQKNLDNSQFLYSKFNLPFLFNTNLGTSFRLDIEKFDTSFLRLYNQFNLNYYLKQNQTISFIYKRQWSNILGYDENIIRSNKLPDYLDYVINEIGIGYSINKLTRPIFTREGFLAESNLLIGQKKIHINEGIAKLRDNNGESYQRLYDSISLSQNTVSTFISANYFLKLNHSYTWKANIESQFYFSESISQNEMFYFGGIKKPRGFDDNSFVSPFHISISNELQYYISEYFYSNIFVDVSIMKNSLMLSNYIAPYGIGIGFSLKAKDNIIHFNIGTGTTIDNSISISNTKVHINYTNVF